MPSDMAHGADVIHLEADVHATADNVYDYPDGGWVAYSRSPTRWSSKAPDGRTGGALPLSCIRTS